MRYLVAPLNWGLGHATRCIPLIEDLLRQGHEVHLASDGAAFDLLGAEFPQLPQHELPSYHIRYDTRNMVWNIARQLPRLLYAILAEKRATAALMRQYHFDVILSDNRYGCFHHQAESILLTHQLQPLMPSPWLQKMVNWALKPIFAQFDTIWVPDSAEAPGLSGDLSHNCNMHPDIRFIGTLSRMQHMDVEREYDIAVVLSGPEPQRTWFEQRLLEQLLVLPYRTIVVQGQTRQKKHFFADDHLEVVSYMTTGDLNRVLAASALVICRSGYSSIMDLAVLEKPALLIPTPGQTEQEYLADMLANQHHYIVQEQEKIDIEQAVQMLKKQQLM